MPKHPAIFKSKYGKLPGTSYDELIRRVRKEHNIIQKRSPHRQPYVRSKYFSADKVFIGIFWDHLMQKHKGEQTRRAKFYLSAIDLLRNTNYPPTTIFSKDNPNEVLHRFNGVNAEGEQYFVQVKQNKKTGRKDFMSVFPAKKR